MHNEDKADFTHDRDLRETGIYKPHDSLDAELEHSRAEVRELHDQILDMCRTLYGLRNSAIFKLRDRIIPQGSPLQRAYLAMRTKSGFGLSLLTQSNAPNQVEYELWCKKWDSLSEVDRHSIREEVKRQTSLPLFSIVMSVSDPTLRFIHPAIESVTSQVYPNWELIVICDRDSITSVRAAAEQAADGDPRIHIELRDDVNLAVAANKALEKIASEYVGFMTAEDKLPEHALFTFFKYLEQSPNARMLYSDEDRIDASGNRSKPLFKPDWDDLLLLSFDYLNRFLVCRTEDARSIGWFREDLDGIHDWDFVLRLVERLESGEIAHIPHVLYHRRFVANPTPLPDVVPSESLIRVVQEALTRRNEHADVSLGTVSESIQVSFRVTGQPPLVSIIIPTRDRLDLLCKCISSITGMTKYPSFEIVVLDNASVEPNTLDFFGRLQRGGEAKVIRAEGRFNYSALNNRGVRESSGEVIALLNNDIEITDPDWLDRMVAHAMRPGTGAVGPRLIYPNGKVQHAGVLVGFQQKTTHYHVGIDSQCRGYMGRAVIDHHVTAVTGACLVVQRDHYEAVGGLDEGLAVTYNDIDLCLKLLKLGLRNVFAGSVTCIHHELASRGIDDTPEKMAGSKFDEVRWRARWKGVIESDSAYNPNLCLERQTFALALTPRSLFPWRK